MKQTIIDKERKRQLTEKKRKLRRKRLIQRNLILLGGVLVVCFLSKSIIGLIMPKATPKETAAQIHSKNSNQNEALLLEEEQGIVAKELLSEGNLVLVNEQNPIRNYSDEDMVAIGPYLEGVCKLKSTDIKLKEDAAKALGAMLQAFKEEVGTSDLTVVSGYRDFDTQETLHYKNVVTAEASDDLFVAKPDRSEHHTGLAVDFSLYYEDGTSADYDGTGIYSWLNENCYKYGFIVRYDESKKELTGISHEPWHFRYVGKPHAQIMVELNLCLEEYIELLKSYEYYKNPAQGITASSKNYSIYYVPYQTNMMNIPVPASKKYIVSGNNQDGFIVTVHLTEQLDKK